MNRIQTPDKFRRFFEDTIWSIAGLVLMNVIAQFAVYPCWERTLGSASYGNIVYLLAVMNVMAISVGIGINYTRMRRSALGETDNRPYLILMGGGTAISLLILLSLYALGLLRLSGTEWVLYCLLSTATMWRYYADVEYRLHINYKGYFFYYLVIGLGYILGMVLFRLWNAWPIALLPGEMAGLLLVLCKGSVLRRRQIGRREEFNAVFRLALLLVGTDILSHLIFNGDRIILQLFAGSTAVAIYYIASLFGKTMTLITTPLNGVLVGYLAKYEGKWTEEQMNLVTILTSVAIVLASGASVAASHVVLPLLYPDQFAQVRPYLLMANVAQVIYFVGNILTASVLLRFTHARNQLIVNVTHGVLFVAVCVPLAWFYGIDGFCWGLLAVNMARNGLCLVLGYRGVQEEEQR